MTPQDIAIGTLCAWRENRGGGTPGMQSVLNVLQNRATQRNTSVYDEAVRKLQFSAMSAPGDPNLGKGPNFLVPAEWNAYLTALSLANQMANDNLPDITGGATSYYSVSMPEPPYWAASMNFTVEIAGQKFFKS